MYFVTVFPVWEKDVTYNPTFLASAGSVTGMTWFDARYRCHSRDKNLPIVYNVSQQTELQQKA